jgi:hypothetical protein
VRIYARGLRRSLVELELGRINLVELVEEFGRIRLKRRNLYIKCFTKIFLL